MVYTKGDWKTLKNGFLSKIAEPGTYLKWKGEPGTLVVMFSSVYGVLGWRVTSWRDLPNEQVKVGFVRRHINDTYTT